MSRAMVRSGWVVAIAAVLTNLETVSALNEITILTPSDTPNGGKGFGASVDIDGAYIAVGASGDQETAEFSGAVYIFKGSGPNWTEQIKLKAEIPRDNGEFGEAVDLDGAWLVVGEPFDPAFLAPHPGRAFVFRRSGETWTQHTELSESVAPDLDQFGRAVSISGNLMVIGAPRFGGKGEVFIHRWDGVAWNKIDVLSGPGLPTSDGFGIAVATNGTRVFVIASHGHELNGESTGVLFIYREDAGTWIEEARFSRDNLVGNDVLGPSLAVHGDTVYVGAARRPDGFLAFGSVYTFTKSNGTWIVDERIAPEVPIAADGFGGSIAVDGDRLLVGAQTDDTLLESAGSAYFYQWTGGTWLERARLFASDAGIQDLFARRVSIDGLHGACTSLREVVYVFALPADIPAISAWGALLLALLILVLGTILVRLSRRTATCSFLFFRTPYASAFEPNLSAAHDPEHLLVRFTPRTTAELGIHEETVPQHTFAYVLSVRNATVAQRLPLDFWREVRYDHAHYDPTRTNDKGDQRTP